MSSSLSKPKLAIAAAFLAVGVLVSFSPAGVTPPHVPDGSPTGLIPPWSAFRIGVAINGFFSAAARLTTPPDVAALDVATAWWKSELAYGLARHGVFDHVAALPGGATCGGAAASLGLSEFVTCQFMEAAATTHLMNRDAASGAYTLTAVGATFREGRLRDFLLTVNDDATRAAWRGTSAETLRTGGTSGFEARHGTDFWSYTRARPEWSALFDRAMLSLDAVPTGAMLADWRPPREDVLLCDVGGGIGHVLAHVLDHYPRMRGMVLDVPDTAKRSNEYLKERGLSDRAEAVAGDLFKPLPAKFAECDIYHLRFMLHGWPDAENVEILKNIKASAERAPVNVEKSVIVVDHVIDTGASAAMEEAKHLMSINMVSNAPFGARERKVAEYGELFAAAGFRGAKDFKVIPLRTIQTLLEVKI